MKREASVLTLVIALLIIFLLHGILVQPAESQSAETIVIKADGSVEGTDKIQRDGNVYTLTDNISGGIRVQKSYIVVDGAGYTVDGSGEGVGINLSANYSYQSPIHVNNVTVKNLKIINCYVGISNENTSNNTFIGNYVADCDTGFWITGSANNTLRCNTVKDCVTGISINYCGGGNVITENNIISSFSVWLSQEPTVDRNYWSDYLTRYPNAKEIGNSGIWDTPYDREAFKDNHPLIEPVSAIPEFPSWVILPILMTFILVIALVCFKKRNR